MTDKQLIETFRNIKEYCKRKSCDYCRFNVHLYDGRKCQIALLRLELSKTPSCWDMDAIERVVKYETVEL